MILLRLAAIVCLVSILASGCQSRNERSIKFTQYFLKGEELYKQHCSNCHQLNGQGLAMLYPPLDGADYVANNANTIPCIIKHGLSGPLTVNGNEFNQPMPAFEQLSPI